MSTLQMFQRLSEFHLFLKACSRSVLAEKEVLRWFPPCCPAFCGSNLPGDFFQLLVHLFPLLLLSRQEQVLAQSYTVLSHQEWTWRIHEEVCAFLVPSHPVARTLHATNHSCCFSFVFPVVGGHTKPSVSRTPPGTAKASLLLFRSAFNSPVASMYFCRIASSIQESHKGCVSSPPLFAPWRLLLLRAPH